MGIPLATSKLTALVVDSESCQCRSGQWGVPSVLLSALRSARIRVPRPAPALVSPLHARTRTLLPEKAHGGKEGTPQIWRPKVRARREQERRPACGAEVFRELPAEVENPHLAQRDHDLARHVRGHDERKSGCGRPDLPVVLDLDFGHTDPQMVLPNGGRVILDPTTQSITLPDPATAPIG